MEAIKTEVFLLSAWLFGVYSIKYSDDRQSFALKLDLWSILMREF
jgi:hypothetical protein